MSKIALTPNASGDGVFTITAPNSGTNRAIALPDAAGTIPLLAAASNTAITSTPAELNILDGVTSTAAELNILDGVTSTTAELNILDGVTSTAAELNILDGVTATTAEINLIDGGATIGTTALADGDGILINDGGTMRVSTVQTVKTYMSDGVGPPSITDNGNATAMTIDSSENILIGQTATIGPGQGNNNDGHSFQSNGKAYHAAGNNVALHLTRRNNGDLVSFRTTNNGTEVGTIVVTSNATQFNTSSDYCLKTDAQPMTGASARVQALKPVNFEWISDGTRTDGFIAHEAQAVVPEAVAGTKDAVDSDGNPHHQGIDQSKIVPLLTAALQEALTEIAGLKARVAALEES